MAASSAVIAAVASSSAHGISRAASAKPLPLRVMWFLLFFIFLAFFLKSGVNLVAKLRENKLTKIYHLDQVGFVFPDLYFCPSNPYSGSYPHSLTRPEAEELNSKVSQILSKYERLYNTGPNASDIYIRTLLVQSSLPFDLIVRHLVHRKEQAVLWATLTSNYVSYGVRIEAFYHPENLVCFKVHLTEELKSAMQSTSSSLEIWLSTDPYFSDFNFTGHQIDPITDGAGNAVPFLSWHPVRSVEPLKISGYTMLIVPPGAYPSLKFENNFHLAPGNAYSVKLEMQENACSQELHKTHCVSDQPQAAFTNPLTWQPDYFAYSSTTCYFLRKNTKLIGKYGCQMSMYPMPWEFHSWPRCLNVSEVTPNITARISTMTAAGVADLEIDAAEYCKTRVPCSCLHYSASFSFGKWPSVGSSTAQFFASITIDEHRAPGLAKLAQIARQMQTSSHSAHLEGIFRSYVSESMLSVSISAASVMSSQVVLTWSYSFTDFLADTGGLLGLYIGCSMLTVCELLELVYVLVEQVCKRKSQPHVTPGETGDDIPKVEGK